MNHEIWLRSSDQVSKGENCGSYFIKFITGTLVVYYGHWGLPDLSDFGYCGFDSRRGLSLGCGYLCDGNREWCQSSCCDPLGLCRRNGSWIGIWPPPYQDENPSPLDGDCDPDWSLLHQPQGSWKGQCSPASSNNLGHPAPRPGFDQDLCSPHHRRSLCFGGHCPLDLTLENPSWFGSALNRGQYSHE